VNIIYNLFSGKFKDEMGGRLIEEFVGLRSKMYSIKTSDGKVKKTAKGVLTVVKEKDITHDMYKQCLFDQKQMKHEQTKIIQDDHQMYTANSTKTTLSPFNDKKWIKRVESEFTTYSFGHYMIEQEEESELIDILSELASDS
jgi:uncharacterized cupredoxin-like copper-binding protein